MYELYKRTPDDKKAGFGYVLLWDDDTCDHTKFDPPQAKFRKPRHLDFHRAQHDPSNAAIKCTIPTSLNTTFTPFKVEHGDEVPNATGIRLTLLEPATSATPVKPLFNIAYAADTAYFDELTSPTHLGNAEIVILHISQPDPKEQNDPNHLKSNHLGLNGALKLIDKLKSQPNPPRLILIGEFWAGLGDIRIQLCNFLRQRTNFPHIFPMSIGMRIHLPDLTIRCTACKSPTPYSTLKVSPPQEPFGPLSYLCPSCLLE